MTALTQDIKRELSLPRLADEKAGESLVIRRKLVPLKGRLKAGLVRAEGFADRTALSPQEKGDGCVRFRVDIWTHPR
jgi:hypothetical protein